jgi:hypothetical protein
MLHELHGIGGSAKTATGPAPSSAFLFSVRGAGASPRGKRQREPTVHRRDHNHQDNPPDGSNWKLRCLYCHDNEHEKQKMKGYAGCSTSKRHRTRRSLRLVPWMTCWVPEIPNRGMKIRNSISFSSFHCATRSKT